LNSPASLGPGLSAPGNAALFFAGQITGVEGYTESLGTGLMAGINLARQLQGQTITLPPPTTMLGGLYRYLREADPKHFQPMNANFGLLDPLEAEQRSLPRAAERGGSGAGRMSKERKKQLLVERAQADFAAWLEESAIQTEKQLAADEHR
jgi:methylenetetrahydrofolate--tRNA-(uracil-5-)-methyltransferase